MPPLLPGRSQRQAQAFARPQNQTKTLAQQQQGGVSGTIPGTATSALQVAYKTGMIQTYPATALSPNGDQVAGVGAQVLNNDGNPVVVMGNLKATGGSDHADFQDGGFAFLDAAGNQVAGYSQPTGLWGFDGGGGVTLGGFEYPDYMHRALDARTFACDGASHLITATTPSAGYVPWFDTSGNITEPGLYAVGVVVSLNALPTTSGLFALISGPFHPGPLIALDGLTAIHAIPNKAGHQTVQALSGSDVPWSTTMLVFMPTDATGTMLCEPYVQRLAY